MAIDQLFVKRILARHEKALAKRRAIESTWEEISRWIQPEREFLTSAQPDTAKWARLFDMTAAQSCYEAAATVHGLMMNQATKWFDLEIADGDDLRNDRDVQIWRQETVLAMLRKFNSPGFGFNSGTFEGLLDVFGPGSSTMLLRGTIDGMSFQHRPLRDVVFSGTDGKINEAYRRFDLQAWELVDMFSGDNDQLHHKVTSAAGRENKMEQEFCMVHAVVPAAIARRLGDTDPMPERMKFFAYYIDRNNKHLVRRGGFDRFIYITPRIERSANGIEGRGPSWRALPMARLLNTMEKVGLLGFEKSVMPPLNVPAGMTDGLPHLYPNGLNFFKEGQRDFITPIQTANNIPLYEQGLIRRQEFVRRQYMLHVLQAPNKTHLSQDQVNAMLRQRLEILSPWLSPITEDMLGPIIHETFENMTDLGEIPPPPEVLRNRSLEVIYTSPLSMSQRESEVDSLAKMQAYASPFVDRDPTVMDNFDVDVGIRYAAGTFNFPQRLLRPVEQVREIRENRAAQIAQQQQLEQAQMAASAAKDGAQALGSVNAA